MSTVTPASVYCEAFGTGGSNARLWLERVECLCRFSFVVRNACEGGLLQHWQGQASYSPCAWKLSGYGDPLNRVHYHEWYRCTADALSSSFSVGACVCNGSPLQFEQQHFFVSELFPRLGLSGARGLLQQLHTSVWAHSQQHLSLQEDQERLLGIQERREALKKYRTTILDSITQHQAYFLQSALLSQDEGVTPGYVPAGLDVSSCRSVFVGNVHSKVSKTFLTEVFRTVGPLVNCTVIRKAKFSYGFVEFQDYHAAAMAISTLDGRKLFKLPIRVNWAFPSEGWEDWTEQHTIFVGGLSIHVMEAVLFKSFSAYPSCSAARIIWDPRSGRSRGYGFVSFREREDAVRAIEEMTGKLIGDKEINCSWAENKEATIEDYSENKTEKAVQKIIENNPRYTTVYVGNLAYESNPNFSATPMASSAGQSNPSTSGDAGGDHNKDYGGEYGPPLPIEEELHEMEHRRLVDEATNMMLNFAKDPNLAKYMTETTFQNVHAQWKATTTSPPNKKQYSEKELEEEVEARLAQIFDAHKKGKKHDKKRRKSIDFLGYLDRQSTFDKAKKHKKRVRRNQGRLQCFQEGGRNEAKIALLRKELESKIMNEEDDMDTFLLVSRISMSNLFLQPPNEQQIVNAYNFGQVSQEELHAFFTGLGVGVIEDVCMARKRGFGFVRFSTHEEAALAIQAVDGQILRDRVVKCDWGMKPNTLVGLFLVSFCRDSSSDLVSNCNSSGITVMVLSQVLDCDWLAVQIAVSGIVWFWFGLVSIQVTGLAAFRSLQISGCCLRNWIVVLYFNNQN
ncbi:hypothetical protein L7F22_017914 [Adiantum nelumboides]|nr:hypothetical protein [Adiantum nelumboides]